MKKVLSMVLAAAMLLLPVQSFAAEVENTTPSQPAFVMTENGGVMGIEYNGLETYLGIPYATAERFQMPQEVSWDGYITCFNYGEVSPQNATTSRASASMWNLANTTGEMVGNENCQNLNVWTKDSTPETLKPVIFWIHGGGYSEGSSHEITHYEGANLAEFGDVVFVSVNHRLNVLGFLDLSAYGDEYKYSANVGIADIVAALEWVHRNISAFGGDPENVTIVGQSGGSAKVVTLLGTPSAHGLFQKAIAMSGDASPRTPEQSQATAASIVDALGLTAETIDQIKDIPYETLIAAANSVGAQLSPVVDGDFYPGRSIELSKDIPLMTGNVLSELSANTMGMWYVDIDKTPFENPEAMMSTMLPNRTEEMVDAAYAAKFGEMADEIKAEFAKVYPDHLLAEGLFLNDRLSKNGGLANAPLAAEMTELGGTAYNYLVAYAYPMFGGITATHTTSDIPFFFHNLDKMGMYIAGDEVNAYKLQDTIAQAVINFAYTGNPSQEGLEWPAYTVENGECMVFDTVSEAKCNHDKHLLELTKAASEAMSASGTQEAAEPAEEAAPAE